jgi:hypothetical protein
VLLRLFLGASSLIWTAYGLFCFVAPESLTGIAGLSSNSPTGTIELRAMYGGLQVALGVLSGAACFRNSLQQPALITLAFICSGLFIARLLGSLLEAEVSVYTAFGLLFELLSSAFATRLLVGLTGRAAA